MKRLLSALACLLLTLCAAHGALAREAYSFGDYLPADMRAAVEAAYLGWSMPDGALIGGENGEAALVALSKDGKNVGALVVRTDGQCLVTAENDAMFPDNTPFDNNWAIMDKEGNGRPYIWYAVPGEAGFYYDLRYADGELRVTSGTLNGKDASGAQDLNFSLENQGTALRVYDDSYYCAVYVPVTVDISFAGFDPAAARTACETALKLVNGASLIPTTGESDALPQPKVIAFKRGQTYPVYAGPGKQYLRLGEKQSAAVSTNDWIQVFGRTGDWLLIQYNRADRINRIGFITADALPKGADVPELRFTNRPGALNGWITDDPLRNSAEIFIDSGTPCTVLASLGENWWLVETTTPEGKKCYGFTPPECVDLRETHINNAIITGQGADMYADAACTQRIGMYYGGVEVAVLESANGVSLVRAGDALAWQEGYIADAHLAKGALPGEVQSALKRAVPLERAGEGARGFAQASAEAQRLWMSYYNGCWILGEVNGFYHLIDLYRTDGDSAAFYPMDWTVALPAGFEEGAAWRNSVQVTLKYDTDALVRPESGAPAAVTLYAGASITAIPSGDYYLIYQNDLPALSLGYLPKQAVTVNDDTGATLALGALEPADQTDTRYLNVRIGGSQDGLYGWGTRVMVLGEAQGQYLVRVPVSGRFGFFNKGDIRLTGDRLAQKDTHLLTYGAVALLRETELKQMPNANVWGARYDAGTRVWLLGSLGAWWCVSTGEWVGFVPADSLESTPDAPAYAGYLNALREQALYFNAYAQPAVYASDDNMLALLQTSEGPVLTRWVKRAGEWAEESRTGALLGEKLRLLHEAEFNDEQITLGFYTEDSNVEMHAAFQKDAAGWALVSFSMREEAYADNGNMNVLYDHTFIVQDGALRLENEAEAAFTMAESALALEGFKAYATLARCQEYLAGR